MSLGCGSGNLQFGFELVYVQKGVCNRPLDDENLASRVHRGHEVAKADCTRAWLRTPDRRLSLLDLEDQFIRKHNKMIRAQHMEWNEEERQGKLRLRAHYDMAAYWESISGE